jgi:uncharacterized membrane protein
MLLGESDWWIKLNSVLWSGFTLVMIFVVSKDLFNSRFALVAASVFAVSPLAVFYAQEARMYSMLMFFGIGSFYFTRRFIKLQNWLSLVGMILFTEIFLYSHGASFLIFISLSVHAGWVMVESRFAQWKAALKLGLALLIMITLYVPWLRQATSISVGHTLIPTLKDVIYTLFILLFGIHGDSAWVEWIAVLLITIGIVVCLLRNRESRLVLVAYVITPVVFCLIISYLFRPIWLYRTLAYTEPFWSIAVAVLVFQTAPGLGKKIVNTRRLHAGLVLVTTAILLFSTLLQQTSFSYYWNFKKVALFINSEAHTGDVVYVPDKRVFWGIGWYLVGPGSVNPLKTNYSLVSQSGIKLISQPGLPANLDDAHYWLVYRPMDTVAPFEIKSSYPVWDFEDLKVVQERE